MKARKRKLYILPNLEKIKTLKIGDKIKSFEVKNIIYGINNYYKQNGSKLKYKTKYYLLENPKGQQRVLEINKEHNLNECETIRVFWNSKLSFKKWNEIQTYENYIKN